MQLNKFLRMLFLLLGFIFATTVFAENAEYKMVQQAYYDWCATVSKAHGDAQQMVKFYAPGAILLPTLSAKILMNTQGGLNEYFANFTRNPNIQCIPQKLLTRVENNIGINNGLYTFTYNNQKGQKVTVPARFTFVYKKQNSAWMIITHHSSKLP